MAEQLKALEARILEATAAKQELITAKEGLEKRAAGLDVELNEVCFCFFFASALARPDLRSTRREPAPPKWRRSGSRRLRRRSSRLLPSRHSRLS